MRSFLVAVLLVGCVDQGSGPPAKRVDPGYVPRHLLETVPAHLNLKNKHFTKEDAKRIGESLGIDWRRFDIEQFRIGLNVELDHGSRELLTNVTNDDEIITGKIALAHLNEFPDYYTRLKKMENKGNEVSSDNSSN